MSLDARAQAAGLQRDWVDAAGRPQRVDDETLEALLAAIGEGADDAPPPLVTTELGQGYYEPGYYQEEGRIVAVAPPRGWTVRDALGARRGWGAAVQIPSLVDRRHEAFGDYEALRHLAAGAGRAGADALAISPVHALFPADPGRFAPYGPSSRLFLNILLADPEDGKEGPAPGALIDWAGAIEDRLGRLRARFARRSDADRQQVEAFAREGGESLARHARFDALHAHFFERQGGGGWQSWPAAYQDPGSPAVRAFAEEHREEIDFFLFCQWLADRQLAAVQGEARASGMKIGLIADLAVGMDPGGSHAWSRPGALLTGCSIGAPPDPLGPDGQNWGITTFSPTALRRTGFEDFIATIRAALRHAGGVRIDHAMGLGRLWVVPHGFPATRGAYLSYPEQDLMRLLALESWRAKAIVIGEDLGTVPPGFRELMGDHGLLGMRVLWFEREEDGGFRAPQDWDEGAAAMTSTHDLPTVAGWWRGVDLDWTWRIGRTSAFASREEEDKARAAERSLLWQAIGAGRPQPEAEAPSAAVNAALRHTASSRCDLALIPCEDLLGLEEQPNLPGTIDQHPNWRRRLPVPSETLFDAPEVAQRVRIIGEARGR